MNKPVVALFLYLGLMLFFAVNAMSVLRGVPVLVAVGRGSLALLALAALGVVAGTIARERRTSGSEFGAAADLGAASAAIAAAAASAPVMASAPAETDLLSEVEE